MPLVKRVADRVEHGAGAGQAAEPTPRDRMPMCSMLE